MACTLSSWLFATSSLVLGPLQGAFATKNRLSFDWPLISARPRLFLRSAAGGLGFFLIGCSRGLRLTGDVVGDGTALLLSPPGSPPDGLLTGTAGCRSRLPSRDAFALFLGALFRAGLFGFGFSSTRPSSNVMA